MTEQGDAYAKVSLFLEGLNDLIDEALAEGVPEVGLRRTLLARAILQFKEHPSDGIAALDCFRSALERDLNAEPTVPGVPVVNIDRWRPNPSLRQLRRRRPANVTILPTTAERKVQQQYGRAYAQAKCELIDGQPVAFPFKFPGEREVEQHAQSIELRADVPPFDPGNPRHLRAWEAIWDFGKRSWPSPGE